MLSGLARQFSKNQLFSAVVGTVWTVWIQTSCCQPYDCPQLPDRRLPLGDGDQKASKVAGPHLKTNTVPHVPKPNDAHKIPEVPRRRTSVDVCLPQRLPSPSPSPSLSRHYQPMPLPLPSQSGCKTAGKRPVLGGEGLMPPNLLNELNSVLSKTGRSAKNSDWRRGRRNRTVHLTVTERQTFAGLSIEKMMRRLTAEPHDVDRIAFMRDDHSPNSAFELRYIKTCRCTRGCGKQVQETVEVT